MKPTNLFSKYRTATTYFFAGFLVSSFFFLQLPKDDGQNLYRIPTIRTEKPSGSQFNYFLPLNYTTNSVKYFSDLRSEDKIFQPEVYNIGAHLADQPDSNGWLIDVGCGTGIKSSKIFQNSKLRFVEIDFGENLEYSKKMFQDTSRYKETNGLGVEWHVWDASKETFPTLENEKIKGATIIAADVIEHIENPDKFVDDLLDLIDHRGAGSILISSPNRLNIDGPPANLHHIREWTIQELAAYLISRGAPVRDCILTNTIAGMNLKETTTCLITHNPIQVPETKSITDYFGM